MSIHNLDRIFNPESVVVIGSSEREGSVGYALMHNLIHGGYQGRIYPVNSRHEMQWDLPCYDSVERLAEDQGGEALDLAIIATPIQTTPRIVQACSHAGMGGAVIISAGGKETGEKGRQIESAILREADKTGFRIIGPNCLGIISSHCRLNASFANHMTLPGRMAFISQSGAICTSILDLSMSKQIGFSHFASLGSMLDIDFGDMIDFLGGDPDVGSIVMYIENLSHHRNFMSAARAVSRIKPIIAVKAGRSIAGARAAASHTGALAGEDSVYDAAFERAGIIRVNNFEELFDTAEVVSKQRLPTGPGLAVITNAGGPGVMVADALSDYGMEPVALRPETIDQLNQVLPPHWSHGNPIDIIGDASPERYRRAVEICLNAREINGLLIMLTPQSMTEPAKVAVYLKDLVKDRPYPVFASWMGGVDVFKGRKIFTASGIPTFHTPERAVRAFMNLYRYSKNLETLQQIPPMLPNKLSFDVKAAGQIIEKGMRRSNATLTEVESKQLLAAYGIPVIRTDIAATADAAQQIAEDIGFPVAMKIYSRDITHKSDADGVHLDLKNREDVQRAFERSMAGARAYRPDVNIEGVTVQPMLKRREYELIIGAKQDRDFGPVILFGMGGVMTEILKDRAIALPPLNRLLARQMMQKTRVYRLLEGFRNQPPANLLLLEEILIRLSQLVTDFAEIAELDINPLLVQNDEVYAVDARVMLKTPEKKAPHHLVISSYPNQYERRITLEDNQQLLIRPIRPEDAPLFRELFESLSPRSVYYRFFSPIRKLPHDMLARFTQVDYDRDISLVAMKESNHGEKMLGVGRSIMGLDPEEAEFSILVHDDWQGKGIGSELLKRCLCISREKGIRKVWGHVLYENRKMMALGEKLGFEVQPVPNSSEFKLIIDLEKMWFDFGSASSD